MKKRWSVPGRITGGQCELVVEAATKEEALQKFIDGDWLAEDGSWECDFELADPDDHDELEAAIVESP